MPIPSRILSAVALLAGILAGSPPALAAPVLGFIEKWAVPGPGSWDSQATNTNPGTGGVDGVGDGYLKITRSPAGQLASHSIGLEYSGDWIAAGVSLIRLWLNDVDANQDLEIHVVVGNSGNFWECKTGFSPPENAWAQFSVDLTDSNNFAQIINFESGFAKALRNADRLQVRHDRAPFVQRPDLLAGEFGLDNVELGATVGVPMRPPLTGLPIELAAPYPNPSRGAVACAFETFDDGIVRVAVIDAAGRIVRAETLPGSGPGRRIWMWNGLDDHGQVAPAGAYRVRVKGTAGGTSRPFIRVN